MLRGLINDHIHTLRECLLLSSSLLVSLSAGLSVYALSGKKTDIRIRALLAFCVSALTVLVCPVTASALRMVTGTYYDSQDMWHLLPLIPAGAVMSAALFDELYSRSKKASFTAIVLFASAILICGSMGRVTDNSSGRYEHCGAAERDIAELIANGNLTEEGSVLLASDDMMAYIRVAHPEIRTLYGRDMWDGRLTKNRYGYYPQEICDIHDDMLSVYGGIYDGKPSLAPELSLRAFENGADHILFPGYVSESDLRAAGCKTVSLVASDGSTYILASCGEDPGNGEDK